MNADTILSTEHIEENTQEVVDDDSDHHAVVNEDSIDTHQQALRLVKQLKTFAYKASTVL